MEIEFSGAAREVTGSCHVLRDHAGRLPSLIGEGYEKTIWTTSATRDLRAIMLADSAHIQ